MEALLTAAGVSLANVTSAIAIYWIIPVGLVALHFYGRHHFNTPEYALSSNVRDGGSGLVRNMPLAKLRGLAPPMFTTSRARYRRYAFRYIAILQSIFLLITCAPDLVLEASGLVHIRMQLAESVQQRGLWALFGLTGLLSSFPALKDFDGWLLSFLHKSAVIPDGAELTAATLFDAEFRPGEQARRAVVQSLRTKHVTRVAQGEAVGSLEMNWLNVRCLHYEIARLTKMQKYTLVSLKLRSDVDEADETLEHLRTRLFNYFQEQDKLVPDSEPDIDSFIEGHQSEESFKLLVARRKQFSAEVAALLFRLCRFATIMIFATESRPEAMNETLHTLGFQVEVTPVPNWNWEAIFNVGAALLVAILIPSFAYGLGTSWLQVQVPASLTGYVPENPKDVFAWGLTGMAMHVTAILIAIKVKRASARRKILGVSRRLPDSIVALVYTYAAVAAGLLLLGLIHGGVASGSFFWATMPATTAYFVSKYIDKAQRGKPVSYRKAAKQSCIMGALAVCICSVGVIDTFKFQSAPVVFWYFTGYCAAVGLCIGASVGILFQRLYSHRERSEGGYLDPDLAPKMGRYIVGDLVLEQTPVNAMGAPAE